MGNRSISPAAPIRSESTGSPSCPVFDEGLRAEQGGTIVDTPVGAPAHRSGWIALGVDAKDVLWILGNVLSVFIGNSSSPSNGVWFFSGLEIGEGQLIIRNTLRNDLGHPVHFMIREIITPEFPSGWIGELAAGAETTVSLAAKGSDMFGRLIMREGRVLFTTTRGTPWALSNPVLAYSFSGVDPQLPDLPIVKQVPSLFAGQSATILGSGFQQGAVVLLNSPHFRKPSLFAESPIVGLERITFQIPPDILAKEASVVVVNPDGTGVVIYGTSIQSPQWIMTQEVTTTPEQTTTERPPEGEAWAFVGAVVVILVVAVWAYIRRKKKPSGQSHLHFRRTDSLWGFSHSSTT